MQHISLQRAEMRCINAEQGEVDAESLQISFAARTQDRPEAASASTERCRCFLRRVVHVSARQYASKPYSWRSELQLSVHAPIECVGSIGL